MKHLRKSILTLLALTLFGGAGAWAQQGPTQVTEFTTDLIASWATDNSDITLADLQALGLVAVDASVAQAWTGAPTSGYAVLVYGFNEGNLNYILFYNGNVIQPSQSVYTKAGFYNEVANVGVKFFYTGSPAIELTKAGDNQWSLGQTPDYDLELQVEYYQKYALKDIPAGWQILVNGQDSTSSIVGDSLMITETDSVTLVPDGNPRRVKSVTLADEAPATPEYYDKLTKINDSFDDQVRELKLLGRGYQAYNSSLTAAQAYALATYQAAIDGQAVYVIMSSQDSGYEIHYVVSTDASATEHTADLYDICDYSSSAVRMYYVAQ